jgi:ACR3 family arsenite transporter
MATKKMSFFDKYLTVLVAICMTVGVGLGKALPLAVAGLRTLEFGGGSQINIPIAVLI